MSAVTETDPLGAQTVRQLLSDVLFKRVRWNRGKTLMRLLLDGLDDVAGAAGSEAERETGRRGELTAMMRRVAADIQTHSRSTVFFRFLTDGRLLTDDEVADLAEYLYSGMVNRFKGELAELLVRPVLREWLTLIAPDETLEIVPGWLVETPSLRHRHIVWKKGADSLIVRRTATGARRIAGVVEIKSYDLGPGGLLEQLENHIRRLRRGVRIGGTVTAVDIEADVELLGIRTCPTGTRISSLKKATDHVWYAELPFTRQELSQAAYLLMQWFLARGGGHVFTGGGDAGEGKIPNPWPEVTVEKAGYYAVMEELHALERRMEILAARDASKRNVRCLKNVRWIYNSLTVGYENANSREMQWLDDFLPPKSGVDALIDVARDAFRKGEFAAMESRIADADALTPNDAQRQQLEWMLAMSFGRRAIFDRALAALPPAPADRANPWRVRDVIMRARLLIRNGEPDQGIALLDTLDAGLWKNLDIDLEVTAVRALAGDTRSADARGQQIMEDIRLQREEARRKKIADPDFNVATIEVACLDFGIALSHAGDGDAAVAWLERIRRPDPWMLSYIDADPWLDAARNSAAMPMLRAEWSKNVMHY